MDIGTDLIDALRGAFFMLLWLVPLYLVLLGLFYALRFRGPGARTRREMQASADDVTRHWFGEGLEIDRARAPTEAAEDWPVCRGVMVPATDGAFVACDALVRTPGGIAVLHRQTETGRIEGQPEAAQWLQHLKNGSFEFDNPLRRNERAIAALSSLLAREAERARSRAAAPRLQAEPPPGGETAAETGGEAAPEPGADPASAPPVPVWGRVIFPDAADLGDRLEGRLIRESDLPAGLGAESGRDLAPGALEAAWETAIRRCAVTDSEADLGDLMGRAGRRGGRKGWRWGSEPSDSPSRMIVGLIAILLALLLVAALRAL